MVACAPLTRVVCSLSSMGCYMSRYIVLTITMGVFADKDGLLRKLDINLSPEADHMKPEWKIGECVGTYYRPNFENIMYPYIPPHIERPKEVRNLYLVHLPEKCYFSVPMNYKLIAVPLFEIYDHIQRYGPVIASIPQMLSRLHFTKAVGISNTDDIKDEEMNDGDGAVKEEAIVEA